MIISIYLTTTNTIITRMMMINTKITSIPPKAPMMLPMSVDDSMSPCVVFIHTGGVSSDVVGVVKTAVTITPAKR